MGKSDIHEIPFSLFERVIEKNNSNRAKDLIILSLLLSLLACRLLSIKSHGLTWLIAFACELWFTFIWILVLNCKRNPVRYKTYPGPLLRRSDELPEVDMLVTAADPVLEPPIILINTILSLLSVDYPSDKLACYVSDDGASALYFYALVEASEFAKEWVPFCKKYGLPIRAPFRYFYPPNEAEGGTVQFRQQRTRVKEKYELLVQRINDASQNPTLIDICNDYPQNLITSSNNHSSIVKVIWENPDGVSDGLPHIVYISREKRPEHTHNYKAGAMNVLARVSGIMTNAEFMLNVDCDMYAHNPQVILHAMCLLLGPKDPTDSAFVQSPQYFYNSSTDYFNVWHHFIGMGVAGLQGPFYAGTGCFHRRAVLYGSQPNNNDSLSLDFLKNQFGNAEEIVSSASTILSRTRESWDRPINLSNLVEASCKVSECGYEYGTGWGKEVGWMYGSTTEDILTGLKIHSRGWKSIHITLDPHAFLGFVPPGGTKSMTQQKRWVIGLLEILFSSCNPIFATVNGRLEFRQCLAYLWIMLWGLRSFPELCYAMLPAYCIFSNTYFLPKGLSLCIPVALFVSYNLCTLWEYLVTGASVLSWWNSQKIGRINSAGPWLIGFLGIITKILGISETVFEITPKGEAAEEKGGFTFDESPVFMPPTTILIVHVMSLAKAVLGSGDGYGVGEIGCSVWVVLSFWTFGEGMFRRGKYGIPMSTIVKSAALSVLFLLLCKK